MTSADLQFQEGLRVHVECDRSSLTFVFPFLFPQSEAESVIARLETASVSSRDALMNVWQRVTLDTQDWLPHVADSLSAAGGTKSILACFRTTSQFFQSERGLKAGAGFRFQSRDSSATPVPLELESLGILIFQNGAGFVTQRWKLKSRSTTDWLDVQHFGHFARLERGGSLHILPHDDGRVRPFPDPFEQRETTPVSDPGAGTFDDLTQTALISGGLGPGQPTPFREVFLKGRLLPYNVLFLQEDADLDESRETVLYRLRRMFHSRQTHSPAPEQLAIAEPNFYVYQRQQWFFFSLEGGGYVAVDAPQDDFFRHTLPGHLETSYFQIFLLALQQRFSLMALSADVARDWKSQPEEQTRHQLRVVFEAIRDRLFDFTARYYFVQVVQRENHHRCYQLWQQKFQTRDLYDEVCSEVHEMSEYLQDRERQARDGRLGLLTLLLTVLIGAPSLAMAFWSINIVGYTSNEGFRLGQAAGHVAGSAGLTGVLFLIIWIAVRRFRPAG